MTQRPNLLGDVIQRKDKSEAYCSFGKFSLYTRLFLKYAAQNFGLDRSTSLKTDFKRKQKRHKDLCELNSSALK